MARYELTDPFNKALQVAGYQLELNERCRILSLVSTDAPRILAQQQFTKGEWSIFITLLTSYPHYASYETLLASLTALSLTDCHKRLYTTQQERSKSFNRELKPVHRVLSGIRHKLRDLSPHLKISLVRDAGYAFITSSM